jgi:acyl-CoA reductase-like NAD-dependent aldehyde dehydrogenase
VIETLGGGADMNHNSVEPRRTPCRQRRRPWGWFTAVTHDAAHRGSGAVERATVDALVQGGRDAQQRFVAWDEDAVDALIVEAASAVAERADELALACVEETGVGSVTDKVTKIRFASLEVAASLMGRPGVGAWIQDDERDVWELAEPAGVVVGLIPMTNPVATTVFKALICLKSRNSLILSAHRDAAGVSAATVDVLRDTLCRHGAPADLIQDVRTRTSRGTTEALMTHPDVALILATGGAGLVRAAYSSGTPAIGVGPGNAPVWVAPDADLDAAARMAVAGKAFDHGIICGSENNLVVDRSVRDRFVAALGEARAAVLSPAECQRLEQAAFGSDGRLRKSVLGKSPQVLAELANIELPPDTRVLVAPVPRTAVAGPFGGEKLAPLLSLFDAHGDEDAISLCRDLLDRGGRGHTAVIHSGSTTRHLAMARALPASRILVNSVGAHGCIGLGNGLSPSLTLGCGTYGHTSTTDNITYTHLLNIKRLVGPGQRCSREPDRATSSSSPRPMPAVSMSTSGTPSNSALMPKVIRPA